MEIENVISLFDGISCGQLALNKANIKYSNYYASEIDKYAIQVTQHNFPNTIQIGDVTKVEGKNFKNVGLLIGGSPCQGFSFAGKQLNFSDPRSKLFFEFVRLKNELQPKYFLLENVKMKKEFQDVISYYLGVKPIEINSSLVSAQSRRRLYWTNIPNIELPTDKNLYIKDILEEQVDSKYFLSKKGVVGNIKSSYEDRQPLSINSKSRCLKVGGNKVNIVKDWEYWQSLNENSNIDLERLGARNLTPKEYERLQTVPDNYTSILSDAQRYKSLGNGWTVDVIAHIFKHMI